MFSSSDNNLFLWSNYINVFELLYTMHLYYISIVYYAITSQCVLVRRKVVACKMQQNQFDLILLGVAYNKFRRYFSFVAKKCCHVKPRNFPCACNATDYIECTRPAGNYLLKFNNRNSRTRCEICSKLTIKTVEQRQWLMAYFSC